MITTTTQTTTDWRKGERITYPTGLTVDRYDLRNPRGTLKIHVEQVVKLGRRSLGYYQVGDCTVEGTIIPKGARGLICHESLPIRTYRAEWYGKRDALAQAQILAWKWYEKLLSAAKGGPE